MSRLPDVALSARLGADIAEEIGGIPDTAAPGAES